MPSGTPRSPRRVHLRLRERPGPYPLSADHPDRAGLGPSRPDGRPVHLHASYETCSDHTHYHPDGRSQAGSGAIWSLDSDALRPAGWTSADAAGLPILPGLVNYDEVASGAMDHAIRFTVACTQESYLWPARHEAGPGRRRRARRWAPASGSTASFTLPASSCAAFCQTVLTTMKTYGMILADNGSNWYFQGTADTRWTATEVDQLKQIPASAFQAVDESCLEVSADSGQARQPGTPAYAAACG